MATFLQVRKLKRAAAEAGIVVQIGYDEDTAEMLDVIGDGQDGNFALAQAKLAEIVAADAVAEAKLVGFDYNGTMVSATRDDQNGLAAVFIGISNGFTVATNFEFSNGATLTIDAAVLADFAPQWTTFRNSFFTTP